jgi:hypothetical protein
MAIQFHLIVKFQVSLLDSLLDPHPEDPAVIDGVRVSIMEDAVTLLFNPIGPKHRMPFRQLDSAFLYQELKEFISYGDVEVICVLGLIDPPLVHSQRFLAPHDLSGGHFLFIIRISHLVGPLKELIVDVSYVAVFSKHGVLLETIGLVAHQ